MPPATRAATPNPAGTPHSVTQHDARDEAAAVTRLLLQHPSPLVLDCPRAAVSFCGESPIPALRGLPVRVERNRHNPRRYRLYDKNSDTLATGATATSNPPTTSYSASWTIPGWFSFCGAGNVFAQRISTQPAHLAHSSSRRSRSSCWRG